MISELNAVDELMVHLAEHAKPSPGLKRFHEYHQRNPQVLDFLRSELWIVRDDGLGRASVHSLFHRGRWELLDLKRGHREWFVLPNNFAPFYARLIVILDPELNGFFEMSKSRANADFGVTFESDVEEGRFRRLVWEDGTPLEDGWRPSTPHVPRPVALRSRPHVEDETDGRLGPLFRGLKPLTI